MNNASRHDQAALLPPLFKLGQADGFFSSGRTMSVDFSPRDNSMALYATPTGDPQSSRGKGSVTASDTSIYIARADRPPAHERRLFIVETFRAFGPVQDLTSSPPEVAEKILAEVEPAEALKKLAIDYVNFCAECTAYSYGPKGREGLLQYPADHYESLYATMDLFQLLYLPGANWQDVPIGEPLLEWLNKHYIDPSPIGGDHLCNLERPWEDDEYWPYLTRAVLRGLTETCTIFLDRLQSHPLFALRELAALLSRLLNERPRMLKSATDKEFIINTRRWKHRFQELRIKLGRVAEQDRDDGFDNWWERLNEITGVLEGRQQVMKRVCSNLGLDWKERVILYCIHVNPRLHRDTLQTLTAQILEEAPCNASDPLDVVLSSLFLVETTEALSAAARVDIWLAAHLADLMEAGQAIRPERDDSGLTLREHYLIAYAEYLRANPELWRITVKYLCACGEVGKRMADEVLLRVPFKVEVHEPTNEDDESVQSPLLRELNKTCFELGREETRRMICKVAAQQVMQQRQYGMAATYSVLAEDWEGLGRNIDCMLMEYFERGPEEYVRLAKQIAPSLLKIEPDATNAIFLRRVHFALWYADFHDQRMKGDLAGAASDLLHMFRRDIAPISWWAVLLSDAAELLQSGTTMTFQTNEASLLLRILSEVTNRSEQDAADDYLPLLAKTTQGGDYPSALQRLQIVRLILHKYYAKCSLAGTGKRTAVPMMY
ncbi:uncharacterized protein LAESUDRAFT_677822 [Laetiporus sulphureus 93-53]|uniref:Nuclear pore complex protein Nup85 n=1 Tax=Laetiporus sulphureus 93-53 TaxID=1314785 RepID=A0A165EMY4_9APHY|nr:uncharacterized protein LAESUDRAFT_677822 [Laetiporus sulphureus 93-53]KZT07396.1 hypothetical protein LAESUDRAFT_677822 [Laetiporus sulphureus 93-53]